MSDGQAAVGGDRRGSEDAAFAAAHLREVRDALRLVLDEQIHTLDQLIQRSAVLLGAASVLAGLLAASSSPGSAPVWRHWTAGVAFAALLVSLFAGIVAVWPRKVMQQPLSGGKEVSGVATYAGMDPKKFLLDQCDEAYVALTTAGYASIIRFRRPVFRVEAAALVIGGTLIDRKSV